MSKELLIRDLRKLLKEEQILTSATDLKLYDSDATSLFKKQAALIVLPETVGQVSEIIKLINKHEMSFVARGAGTGLSGGAIAAENSVIISIARLNQILEVDVANKCALVESGVVNLTLSESIAHTGLHFSPDPSSQKACTIGGNVAENAGGIHCYKYGVTSEHVLGLEVVLPDGEIVCMGGLSMLNATDPTINKQKSKFALGAKPYAYDLNPRNKTENVDITGFFIGSEGTFAVVSKVLVRLSPIPKSFLTMQVSFTSVRKAAELVAAIIKHGFKPAALEMMDTVTIQAVDKAFKLGLFEGLVEAELNAILLIELDGDADEVLLEASKIRKLIQNDFEPLRYRETQDPSERALLWKVRKGAAAAFGNIAPYWYLYDLVVPRSKIPDAMDEIREIADKHDLLLANVFHAADGNLHPNFLYDLDKDPGVVKRIFAASHELMEMCVRLGGTLSGEHGIGVEKQEYMKYIFSEADMKLMLRLRQVFDPKMISNPEKLFPVRICREAACDQALNRDLLLA